MHTEGLLWPAAAELAGPPSTPPTQSFSAGTRLRARTAPSSSPKLGVRATSLQGSLRPATGLGDFEAPAFGTTPKGRLRWKDLSVDTFFPEREASSSSNAGLVSERPDTGLSMAARRENLRREQYAQQLERAREASNSPLSRSLRGGGHLEALAALEAEAVEILNPQAFLENVNALDHQIEDLTRSIRLEHLSGGQEDRQKAEREEARRKREAELRRARKKEQEARDPHKKVALRLENKRRFESDLTEEARLEIPMQKIEVTGNLGKKEQVSLVDVRTLQSKCQFLDEGASVRTMLETQRRRERLERACSSKASTMLHSLSSPDLSQCFSSSHVGLETYEERLERVVAQRHARQVDAMIQKLGRMRNKLPYDLPFKFDVVGGSAKEAGGSLVIAPKLLPGMTSRHKDADVARTLAHKVAAGASGSKGIIDPMELEMLLCKVGTGQALMGALTRRIDDRKALSPTRRCGAVDFSAAWQISRERAQKRWMFVRAFVQWLLIYFLNLRRMKSIGVLKALLVQMGEWARIRRAMSKTVKSVKILQRTCKNFTANKRRRCATMEREWLRVEDQHLTQYFRMYAQKILDEQRLKAQKQGIPMSALDVKKAKGKLKANTAEAKQALELQKLMEASLEGGDLQIDWRAYRIPAADRRALVSRFYMVQLKKHVQSQKHFLAAVKRAFEAEKELMQFLKSLGAEDSQTKDCQVLNKMEHNNFWHLTEDHALILIALSAQALFNVEPFQDHPANKDVPENSLQKRVARNASPAALVTLCLAAVEGGNSVGRNAERISLGRMAKRAEPASRSAARGSDGSLEPTRNEETPSRRGHLDMDELFRNFTPRLREISEGQIQEHRSQPFVSPEGRHLRDET